MTAFQRSALLLLLASASSSSAFVVTNTHARSSRSAFSTTSSSLSSTKTKKAKAPKTRVEEAGCGIAIVPAGNNQLFDPNVEGKIGGTQARIEAAYNYPSTFDSTSTTASASTSTILDSQNWLEDIGLPLNFAKPQAPVTATVLGRTRIIGDDAPGDIQHVVLQLPEGMHYVEGQSLSVIPPGVQEKNGKPHKPRLYSIASTRYGDLLNGNTVSLCVRRAEYYDPSTGTVDDSKAGVCSSWLCGAKAGDTVSVAGPVGKTMLLPEDSTKDIIMVATGTGIAPFRAFLHRLFMEQTVARHMFSGNAWLILGVPVTSGLLYPEELGAMQDNAAATSAGSLTIDYAISREMTNTIDGGKLYVQHVLAQQADKLLEKLESGAVIYFCGLKGMMPGILEALEQVCTSRNMDFSAKLKEWKGNHQWHVEVY